MKKVIISMSASRPQLEVTWTFDTTDLAKATRELNKFVAKNNLRGHTMSVAEWTEDSLTAKVVFSGTSEALESAKTALPDGVRVKRTAKAVKLFPSLQSLTDYIGDDGLDDFELAAKTLTAAAGLSPSARIRSAHVGSYGAASGDDYVGVSCKSGLLQLVEIDTRKPKLLPQIWKAGVSTETKSKAACLLVNDPRYGGTGKYKSTLIKEGSFPECLKAFYKYLHDNPTDRAE